MQPKKRGLRAGYVSQLENRLGTIPEFFDFGESLTLRRGARARDSRYEESAADSVTVNDTNTCRASSHTSRHIHHFTSHAFPSSELDLQYSSEQHQSAFQPSTNENRIGCCCSRLDDSAPRIHMHIGGFVVQRVPTMGAHLDSKSDPKRTGQPSATADAH